MYKHVTTPYFAFTASLSFSMTNITLPPSLSLLLTEAEGSRRSTHLVHFD